MGGKLETLRVLDVFHDWRLFSRLEHLSPRFGTRRSGISTAVNAFSSRKKKLIKNKHFETLDRSLLSPPLVLVSWQGFGSIISFCSSRASVLHYFVVISYKIHFRLYSRELSNVIRTFFRLITYLVQSGTLRNNIRRIF